MLFGLRRWSNTHAMQHTNFDPKTEYASVWHRPKLDASFSHSLTWRGFSCSLCWMQLGNIADSLWFHDNESLESRRSERTYYMYGKWIKCLACRFYNLIFSFRRMNLGYRLQARPHQRIQLNADQFLYGLVSLMGINSGTNVGCFCDSVNFIFRMPVAPGT